MLFTTAAIGYLSAHALSLYEDILDNKYDVMNKSKDVYRKCVYQNYQTQMAAEQIVKQGFAQLEKAFLSRNEDEPLREVPVFISIENVDIPEELKEEVDGMLENFEKFQNGVSNPPQIVLKGAVQFDGIVKNMRKAHYSPIQRLLTLNI